MRRFLRFVSGLLIVAANLGAAVYLAMLTAPGRGGVEWQALLADLAQKRWTVFGAAILYFLIWMVLLGTWRTRRMRERFLTFESDQGPVSISTLAIADFLTRLAAEFPSIVRIEPHIIPRHNTIDVLLDVRVKAGTQVNDMCQLLQQRVRQSLIDEMGIPEVNLVRVNVGGIAGEHRLI